MLLSFWLFGLKKPLLDIEKYSLHISDAHCWGVTFVGWLSFYSIFKENDIFLKPIQIWKEINETKSVTWQESFEY